MAVPDAYAENTFKAIAIEWHTKNPNTWTASTAHNIKRFLEKDIFPWLGNRVIKDIAAPELLAVLRRIESRGAHEKAQRCRAHVGRVCLGYAVATGRAERYPSGDLKGALTPVKVKHHPSIKNPKGLVLYYGQLMVSGVHISPSARYSLPRWFLMINF
ncbi:MAG: hypothetical protein MRK00_16210 [Nitrosomonas sp.]|nr:hypothetical protein [Nitrosomonas sp.]